MNTNKTVEWILENKKDKIVVLDEILENKKDRGIYGIFIVDRFKSEEYCAYVGRAFDIYKRMFCHKNAHLVKLKNNRMSISRINEAMKDDNKVIEIRILERVSFEYNNYNKDMQHFASRENYYIDYYQKKDQCLEQLPMGMNTYGEIWDKEKKNEKSRPNFV